MNISIIIFCYNERQNIEAVIHSAKQAASRVATSYEIIVVNDGSMDGTTDVLNRCEAIQSIHHAANAGIGMALRSGYAAATKEYVCAIPGDGQFDAKELLQIKPFSINQFYSFYRRETNYNAYRKILSFLNKIFNQVLLGIEMKDVNWIKIYRKDQLDFVQAELKSSIIESEICAKLIKSGCVPIEIPSKYCARKAGSSAGGNWKTLSRVLSEMFKLYRVVRNFKKQFDYENFPRTTFSYESLNLKQHRRSRF